MGACGKSVVEETGMGVETLKLVVVVELVETLVVVEVMETLVVEIMQL